MEVKPGYKQTEVGVIPQDWDVKNLRDCLISNPDYGINAPAVPYSDTLPVYIRITDITDDGKFSPDNIVSVRHIKADSYYLNDGDLVFARTGASVGKSYLYNRRDGSLVFAGFLIRVRTNPAKLIPEYLSNYIQTGPYWSWVKIMSTRSGQPGINGHEYGQLPIPLPKTEEQRAIAVALSDVDDLITGLDQLIAKKRDIKQAAMQELLTGKRRLPGFSGEWGFKRFEEIADIDCDNLTCDTSADYAFKYISLENVDAGTLRGYSDLVFRSAPSRARRKVRKDDILVSTVRPNLKSHLLVKDEIDDLICSTGFSVLRCKKTLADPAYVYYHLFANDIERQIESLLSGSNYPAINGNDVKALHIPLPPLSEQAAIAQILSDMDTEIAALEARCDKTKALKQGMMQELLTGRIRLVEGGAA